MNIWSKIKKWEYKIEKAPRVSVIRLGAIIFTISVVMGLVLSKGVEQYEIAAHAQIVKDIQNAEKMRMNTRIQKLEQIRSVYTIQK